MADEIKLPEIEPGKIAPGGKILGLPWWGWAVGLVAVVGVVLYLRSRAGGSTFPAAGYPLAPGTANLGSGGGGGGGGSVSTGASTPATTTTNADWLQNVVAQAAQAAGVDVQTATAYLTAYLNGNEPIGSNNALTAFNRVIQAAKQIAPAPNPPSSLTFAPLFATSGQYLTAGIGEIGNVPASVQSELTNLANGQTTSISQAAANILTEIEGLYGTFPGLTYTINQPTATPAATPNFTDQLASDFLSLGSNFDQRVSYLVNTIGLNQQQAGYVAQATHITFAQGGNVTTGLLNSFIADAIANKPLPPNPGNK